MRRSLFVDCHYPVCGTGEFSFKEMDSQRPSLWTADWGDQSCLMCRGEHSPLLRDGALQGGTGEEWRSVESPPAVSSLLSPPTPPSQLPPSVCGMWSWRAALRNCFIVTWIHSVVALFDHSGSEFLRNIQKLCGSSFVFFPRESYLGKVPVGWFCLGDTIEVGMST